MVMKRKLSLAPRSSHFKRRSRLFLNFPKIYPMNKVIMLCMALTMALFANSQQETGIRFDHEHNWSQILAQAKKENKLIFVDAFTTWCGPCRFMSKNIFPLKEVGDFYNEHFIMLKAQLDTSTSDNDYVKA